MKYFKKQSMFVLMILALIMTSCDSDDDNNFVAGEQPLQGYEDTRAAVDGVADFIDGPIGNLTEDLGELTMAESGFTRVTVDTQARVAATNAVAAYEMNPTDANAVEAANAIEALVVANRVAIIEDFQQILGEDFPTDSDLGALIASVEERLDKPENLMGTQSEAFDVILAVQINGTAVEALLNIANTRFDLGLDVPAYAAPSLPASLNTQNLLETALNSVTAVGNLAVPSVEAIQAIVDEQLNREALGGYEDFRVAVDGVADFIDGPIGKLIEDLGMLTDNDFARVIVDVQVRADAMSAVEAYQADPSSENAITAANEIENLVVANRVAIIEDFQQILGDDFPSDEDLAALIASVEDGFERPSDLSGQESAIFDAIVAVQINGTAVEALLNIANTRYELELDIPMYMAPGLPEMFNEMNLLTTASESVAAVGELAVPSVEAIQAIVDDQLGN
ncbi:hypothetical protein [Psychroflexus montanilacus]|uniref:hypothetical protein n=1 Tax=Psychroflexus montanilacus TaxID=2873598 RepID=UPI001CCB9C3C|nr:hypothetical protein [Psychroflexus montanilacus]MBZ9650984.1 hypothetical protein [Psychroflexus montanilacus]